MVRLVDTDKGRNCLAVAWHPHDEHHFAFADAHCAVNAVNIVGELLHSGAPHLPHHTSLACKIAVFSEEITFATDVRHPDRYQQLLGKYPDTHIAEIHSMCISPDSQLWVATRVSEVAIWLIVHFWLLLHSRSLAAGWAACLATVTLEQTHSQVLAAPFQGTCEDIPAERTSRLAHL